MEAVSHHTADPILAERRERVFIALAGVFLCAMTLLNVIGITRFVQLGSSAFVVAVGVLPYPITFLATDLVSELYGRSRANYLVTVGLLLNFFILFCLWLAKILPAADTQPPWQTLELAETIVLPSGNSISGSIELFQLIFACTSGAVFASMMAYVAAQYCDVHLFHFFKRLTNGKHLWLRNNLSTITSQGVDSFMVISVTFGAAYLAGELTLGQMLTLMGGNYLFKMLSALLDTGPFYLLTHWLKRYLKMDDDRPVDSSNRQTTAA